MTDALALAMTAGIGAFLLTAQRLPEPKIAAASAIQIALETEPSPPSPAPDPPAPEPPKVSRQVVRREIRHLDAAPLMTAEVSMPPDIEASPDQSSGAAAQAPTLKSTPPGDIESQYAATLRTNIDSRTTLPNSPEYRLLRPHGEVRVNFTLDRSGTLIASDVSRGSGSSLLDHHALEIVKTGHYPPFPGDAFQGESRHTFLVTLEFHS